MTLAGTVLFVAAPVLVFAALLFALKKQLRENIVSIIILAFFALLFFHRIVFLSETISQSDANQLQLQFFRVYREAVLDGRPPFWNPHEGTGLPNLAHPLSAMFYPLAPVFLVFNVFKSMSLFVVLHYFTASVFALLLGRRIFRTRPAALVFALLFAYNGWAVTRAAHQPAVEYLFAYAWLPMAALFFERGIDGESLLVSTAGAGAALAWMGIACPNLFIYGALLLFAAAVIRMVSLGTQKRKNALALAVFMLVSSAGFAVALAAVELVPAFELSLVSTGGRMGASFLADYRGNALSLWDMSRLFLPYAPGRPFGVFYSPGVIALLAALYAVYCAVRYKASRFILTGSLVLLAFGALLAARTPLYRLFCAVLPYFARASLVPSALILLVIPVAVVACAGLDQIIERRKALQSRLRWALPVLVAAELFGLFAVVYPRFGERRLTYDYLRETADFPHLDELVRQGDPGRVVVTSPLPETVLAPSYATLERGLSRLNLHLSAFAPDRTTATVERAVADLSADELETLGVGWVVSTKALAGRKATVEIEWPTCIDHFENSLFWPLRNQPGWLAWDKTVHLYRVTDAPALARAAPSPDQPPAALDESLLPEFDNWIPLADVRYRPNRFDIDLGESGASRLFAAVTAYPGWTLWADGHPVEWTAAGEGFIAADLPATARKATLEFTPTAWAMCLIASLGAALFAIASTALDALRA